MKSSRFRRHLLIFVALNAALYAWISLAHGLIDFKKANYLRDAHHYIQDKRIDNATDFSLASALGQYDAQFYLAIADRGYVSEPDSLPRTHILRMAYAFAPLWPILIGAVKLVVGNVEMAALTAAYLTTVAAFAVVWRVVAVIYDEKLALRVAWLMFLQPFSVFFRGYFSESLFIIFFALLLLGLSTKKWFISALAAGLMSVTRFVGVGGVAVTAVVLLIQVYLKKMSITRAAILLSLCFSPLLLFMAYCWVRTGNPLYFIDVRDTWWRGDFPAPFSTLAAIFAVLGQRLHSPHSSVIDVLAILLTGFILVKSFRHLPRVWWYTSLIIWLIPIMTTDTMSAARYQIVQLPLYIFVAQKLPTKYFRVLIVLSAVGLLFTCVYFVSWAWLG